MGVIAGLLRPDVQRHLLVSENEFVVDQVERHWVTRVPGVLLVLAGSGVALLMPFLRAAWPVAALVALGLAGWGFWLVHVENMKRFVVTNVRVFGLQGVFNQRMASVPLARLLDISMDRPFWGQVLNYGHFIFETAATEQGLKLIPYVPDIPNRELILQTVIQRAGVRARAGKTVDEYQEFFESLDNDDPSRISKIAHRLRHPISGGGSNERDASEGRTRPYDVNDPNVNQHMEAPAGDDLDGA